MGCGKSKHDVATGNTISMKKSNGGNQSRMTKDIETVLENGTKHSEASERLISEESPNHYFSSRKEEEAVDGIASEQKSDYESARLEAVKESLFDDNGKVNNAVEATSLVEQSNGETKSEGAVVKEESLPKEAELSTPPTDIEQLEPSPTKET